MPDQDVFTTFEIARLLRVNPSTVQNWARKGKLVCFSTPGGHRRIRRADLLAFIRAYGFPVPSELGGDRLCVLVVDDETEILEVVEAGLQALGGESWEIHTARCGLEALLKVGELRPEVMIHDIVLPDIDGFELCRRVRESSPATVVIAISGRSDNNTVQKIMEAGAREFIEKPFTIVRLFQAVKANAS